MTEREQFEAWASHLFTRGELDRHGSSGARPDEYRVLHIERMWQAWQASAARAQPAQAGHVPETDCGDKAGQVLTLDEIEAAFQQAADADDETHIRFARAIERAVLAKRVPQWLPIETAPKDGKRIMVWMDDQYASNEHAFAKLWFYQDGKLGGGAEGYSGNWSISHWMPLPPPPGIVGEKGGA